MTVVEHRDPVGDHQRMVVGKRDDARSQPDATRPLRRRRDEELGRGDRLEGRGVVLADPELVVAEAIELLGQLEVATDLQARTLVVRVVGGEEDARTERGLALGESGLGHRSYLAFCSSSAACPFAACFRM